MNTCGNGNWAFILVLFILIAITCCGGGFLGNNTCGW